MDLSPSHHQLGALQRRRVCRCRRGRMLCSVIQLPRLQLWHLLLQAYEWLPELLVTLSHLFSWSGMSVPPRTILCSTA